MVQKNKPIRSKATMNFFDRLARKTSNANILANYEANKEETVNALFNELESICGALQAKDIIDVIKSASQNDYIPDCMPLCALSETLHYVRSDIAKNIKIIKTTVGNDNVVQLNAERAQQRLDQMLPVYWMVMKAFYTLYPRFLNGMK